MALNYTLRIEAGATFARTFVIKDATTLTPLDLTGFTAHIQFRKPGTLELAYEQFPTINASAGTISLRVEATDTSAFTDSSYIWACELYNSTDTFRILEGTISVSPEVVY
jgi:hypothetical protein